MSRAVDVDFAAVPEELKLLRRWVVWRYERRGDKRTKVPYKLGDAKAKTTDPADWLEWDAACGELIQKSERYQGIGLVVAEGDGLTVWDFDHILDAKSGQITDPDVAWAIEVLNSYTEITPSGTGLRVLCHGVLPAGRNKRANYEGYTTKRYVTITGRRMPGTSSAVEPRQEAIERVFNRLLKGEPDKLELLLRDAGVLALWNAKTEDAREKLGYRSQSEADLALCRRLCAIGSDLQVDAWFRQSGLYRSKWDRADYRDKTISRARELAASDPADVRLTDLGNAIRFAKLSEGKARFVAENGDWFTYTGKFYERGRLDEVTRFGKLVLQQLYVDAVATGDPDDKKRKFKHAVALESRGRFDSMLAMARAECFIKAEALDADRSLLNLESGTLELPKDQKRTVGVHREHRQEDLLTRAAPVVYDESARCPKWEKFIKMISKGRKDLAEYLQVLAGYSISGYADEQKLFYLYGTGANGKTTFVKTICMMLGDYAAPLEVSTLLWNKQDPHPTGLADLQGLNLAVVSELPDKKWLNEDLIKRITGGETIKARRMHKDFFSFENHAKLWVYGNYKIHIAGADHGIWRRMVMIPFSAKIADEDQIKDYWETLYQEEGPGILNWCLDGFTRWREEGLKVPAEVETATEDYRRSEDTLSEFFEECLVVCSADEGAYTDDVYRAWAKWSEARGERPGTSRDLTERLKDRGMSVVAGGKNRRRWVGLGVRGVEKGEM